MTTKLKISFGDWEIDYEGEPSFLKSELPKLITDLAKAANVEPPKKNPDKGQSAATDGGKVQATTKAIAAAMNYDSGPDLIKAALAHLQLVKGQESATRAQIMAEMKTVSQKYKPSMDTNFSKQINSLMPESVNEPQPKQYCLKDEALNEIRAAVA